jgi:hypothetical protein
MVSVNGKVHKVKCKINNKIKGNNKLLILKLNSLWKQVGWKKTIITILHVATREYYFLKTSQHVLNEHFYVLKGKDFMVQKLVLDIMVIKKNPCLLSIHISYVFSK